MNTCQYIQQYTFNYISKTTKLLNYIYVIMYLNGYLKKTHSKVLFNIYI